MKKSQYGSFFRESFPSQGSLNGPKRKATRHPA
jgi:hypothetical protein